MFQTVSGCCTLQKLVKICFLLFRQDFNAKKDKNLVKFNIFLFYYQRLVNTGKKQLQIQQDIQNFDQPSECAAPKTLKKYTFYDQNVTG